MTDYTLPDKYETDPLGGIFVFDDTPYFIFIEDDRHNLNLLTSPWLKSTFRPCIFNDVLDIVNYSLEEALETTNELEKSAWIKTAQKWLSLLSNRPKQVSAATEGKTTD